MSQQATRRFFDAWNRRDFEAAMECVADDCHYNDFSFTRPHVGKADVRALFENVAKVAPDVTFVIDDITGDYDVGVHWHIAIKGQPGPAGVAASTVSTRTIGWPAGARCSRPRARPPHERLPLTGGPMTTEIPTTFSTLEWANPPAETLPKLVTESPGPKSRALHARMERHQRGSYTRMVALHPVGFASGQGVVLRDVDGNEYIDFSSGIVVTNLGHANPIVAQAVAKAATELDNVHDFAHPHEGRGAWRPSPRSRPRG